MTAARRHRPPLGVRAIFWALLPIAERDEVLTEVAAEFERRVITHGRAAARRWAWRQALGSAPALLRRGWWRGMTGFEPQANRLRPGGPMYESWIMDVRYAARHLRRRPVYASLAVATLALGAGGTVKEMNRIGMIVDISHVSDKTVRTRPDVAVSTHRRHSRRVQRRRRGPLKSDAFEAPGLRASGTFTTSETALEQAP
jgi:hypothetical protein